MICENCDAEFDTEHGCPCGNYQAFGGWPLATVMAANQCQNKSSSRCRPIIQTAIDNAVRDEHLKHNENMVAIEKIHSLDMQQADKRRVDLRNAIVLIQEKWKAWREDEFTNCITCVEDAIFDALKLAVGEPAEEEVPE